MNKNKNVCFFHIATMGHYEHVNSEMLYTMLNCGFLEQLEKLYICKLGVNPLNLPFEHDCFEIIECGKDLKQYEYPTLKKLKEFANNTDKNYNILYICNAGVSHPPGTTQFFYPGWRRLMLHFCAVEYKLCLETLKNFDACGIEWEPTPTGHFSGNFWWITSKFAKTLLEVDDAIKYQKDNIGYSDRHAAEFWLDMNKNIKATSIYHTPYNWRTRPIIDWYQKVIGDFKL